MNDSKVYFHSFVEDLTHFPSGDTWNQPEVVVESLGELTAEECDAVLDVLTSSDFNQFLDMHIPAR
jgi:hypothetical protein